MSGEWEYLAVETDSLLHTGGASSVQKATNRLNELGAEGWELALDIVFESVTDMLVFKRPKPADRARTRRTAAP